jgi:hypothetical protein
VTFLTNGLLDQPQQLNAVDPQGRLPDQRRPRGGDGVVVQGGRRRVVVPRDGRLRISVVNGDLMFEAEALLLGHYRSSRLTGAEQVVDRLIGGAMAQSLQLGLYPSIVGSHQVFINKTLDQERDSLVPMPCAVIVAGLGPEGELKSAALVETVRQAVLAWAQRRADIRAAGASAVGEDAASFTLAATLLGSGGKGIVAGQAARLIAQGSSRPTRCSSRNRIQIDDGPMSVICV